MSDVVAHAKAALGGVADGPWVVDRDDSTNPAYDLPVLDNKGSTLAICPDCGVRGGLEVSNAEFVAAARTLVPELIAEVERLREGVASIEHFARIQALSDRARSGPNRESHHGEERYWLDLLAIIERIEVKP